MATTLSEILDVLATTVETLTPTTEPSILFERSESLFAAEDEQANYGDRAFAFVPGGQNQAGLGWFGDERRESETVVLVVAYVGVTGGSMAAHMAKQAQDLEAVRRVLELPATAQNANAEVIVCEGATKDVESISLTLRIDYRKTTEVAAVNNGRLIDLPLPVRRPRDETQPLVVSAPTGSATTFPDGSTTTLNAGAIYVASPRPSQYDSGALTLAVTLGIASTTGTTGDTGTVRMRVRFDRWRAGVVTTNNVNGDVAMTIPSGGVAQGEVTIVFPSTVLPGDIVTVAVSRLGGDAADNFTPTVRIGGAMARIYDAAGVPRSSMRSGDVAVASFRVPNGIDASSVRVGARVVGMAAPTTASETMVLTLEARRARVGVTFPTAADFTGTATLTLTTAGWALVQETGWFYPTGVVAGDNVELRLIRSGGTYTGDLNLIGWQAYTEASGALI